MRYKLSRWMLLEKHSPECYIPLTKLAGSLKTYNPSIAFIMKGRGTLLGEGCRPLLEAVRWGKALLTPKSSSGWDSAIVLVHSSWVTDWKSQQNDKRLHPEMKDVSLWVCRGLTTNSQPSAMLCVAARLGSLPRGRKAESWLPKTSGLHSRDSNQEDHGARGILLGPW